MHRILKPTGSILLHCNWHANAYISVDILDKIFGMGNFQNCIAWKRTTAHNDPKKLGNIHDTIFWYSKSKDKVFNKVAGPVSKEQLERYKYHVEQGKFRAENLTAPKFSETRTVEWRGTYPGDNRQWRFSIKKLEELFAEGRILLQRNGTPRMDGLKEYLDTGRGLLEFDQGTFLSLCVVTRRNVCTASARGEKIGNWPLLPINTALCLPYGISVHLCFVSPQFRLARAYFG